MTNASKSIQTRLEYVPPFAVGNLIAFLGSRAILNVEEINERTYRRSLLFNGVPIVFEIAAPDKVSHVTLRVDSAKRVDAAAIAAHVAQVFDLHADSLAIDKALRKDPLFKQLVKKRPGLRVPGAFDGFEMAVRAILGQQISVVAARTLAGRVVQRFGTPLKTSHGSITHLFPSAQAIAEGDLTGIGIVGSRARTIVDLARAVADKHIVLNPTADRDEMRKRLLAIRGIGPWTASYIAMRILRDSDAFPDADLGLFQAIRKFGIDPTKSAMSEMRARWHPWGAYAAIHLWGSLAD
jgi:AraC family transcriptional regulator of adaptative response / DNA-3-methyladenine glycosylase II